MRINESNCCEQSQWKRKQRKARKFCAGSVVGVPSSLQKYMSTPCILSILISWGNGCGERSQLEVRVKARSHSDNILLDVRWENLSHSHMAWDRYMKWLSPLLRVPVGDWDLLNKLEFFIPFCNRVGHDSNELFYDSLSSSILCYAKILFRLFFRFLIPLPCHLFECMPRASHFQSMTPLSGVCMCEGASLFPLSSSLSNSGISLLHLPAHSVTVKEDGYEVLNRQGKKK